MGTAAESYKLLDHNPPQIRSSYLIIILRQISNDLHLTSVVDAEELIRSIDTRFDCECDIIKGRDNIRVSRTYSVHCGTHGCIGAEKWNQPS